MQPLVSIIIPSYNSGKYIGECLQSVINQTYTNWECFIVLAPSTDNTLDEIWKFIDIGSPSSKIRIIQEPTKSNCATARNKGFDVCNGKYIAFIDADDWWEPENLETMVTFMEVNSDIMWCAHYQKIHKRYECFNIKELPGTVKEIGGIGGCLYKKSLLDKVKEKYGYVFDQSLNHTDDGDLTLRVRHEKAFLIPKFLSHYRWNEGGLTATTGDINQSWGIVKILIKRGAWDLLPYHLKNLGVCIVEEVTGFDLVRKK
jgi:glycosyltransferase involved in cell wall biosynthesis